MINRPEYDSSCEYGTFSDVIRDNIPDKYHCIDVGFGFLVPAEFPNAYDGRYLIMIYAFYKDKDVKGYLVSIDEPRYIYGSDKLPEDIKDVIIDSLINNYKTGIESINEYCNKDIFDLDRPVPDYTQL